MTGFLRSGMLRAGFEARRLLLILRLRTFAVLKRSQLDLHIERGVRIEGRVLLRVYPGKRMSIRIGKGSRLGDGLRLVLDGGDLVVGERVQLRTGAILHVRGQLTFEDEVVLSYYSVVHCDDHIHVSSRVGLGEHTTISDSTHVKPPAGEWWYFHLATAPVRIGPGVWGGAKVTITRGVTIGADSVLAAGCVVTSDVEPGVTVAGTPAKVIAPSPLAP